MNYIMVKNLDNKVVDDFIANNDLFAFFKAPVNIIFANNFINNIQEFKDIFGHLDMSDNIFFSCKANKSNELLKIAAENGCGIEVSSYYELKDALK